MSKTYGEENYDRDQHTAASANDGQQGFLAAAKFSTQNLTFDLKSHTKEEEEHEEVIDKIHQRHGMSTMTEDIKRTYAEGDVLLPQGGIGFACCGEVGKEECKNGCNDEQAAGTDVTADKAGK